MTLYLICISNIDLELNVIFNCLPDNEYWIIIDLNDDVTIHLHTKYQSKFTPNSRGDYDVTSHLHTRYQTWLLQRNHFSWRCDVTANLHIKPLIQLQNGLLSSMPYAAALTFHLLSGRVFDWCRRKHFTSLTSLRKIFNTIGTNLHNSLTPLYGSSIDLHRDVSII